MKSMNLSTSLSATVVNTSLNYFFTVSFPSYSLIVKALFGLLIFGESLPIGWWMGASLILIGLFLINKGTPEVVGESKKDK